MTVAQLHQHFLGGGVLPRLGLFRLVVEVQTVEQHFAHLCRRCGVEVHAGGLEALLLQFVHLSGEHLAILVKCLHIDTRASHFHLGKHFHQRQLYVGEQVRHIVFLQQTLLHIGQGENDVGLFARHRSESFGIHLKYFFLPTAFRTEVRFRGNHLVVEQFLRHLRNAVPTLWLKQIVRHRGVEIWSGEIHAFLVKHHHVALHIVGADGHAAFVERFH